MPLGTRGTPGHGRTQYALVCWLKPDLEIVSGGKDADAPGAVHAGPTRRLRAMRRRTGQKHIGVGVV